MKSVTTKLGTFVLFAFMLSACGGGGGGGASTPIVVPTPTASPTPPSGLTAINAACLPFGGVGGMSVGRQPATLETRRMPARIGRLNYVPGMIEVNYRTASSSRTISSTVPGSPRTLNIVRNAVGGGELRTYSVDPQSIDASIQAFQKDPNVSSVTRAAMRYISSAPAYLTNDPYFSQPLASNPPVGYVQPTAPCYQNAGTGGQWDQHQIGLEHAFGYSRPGATVVNANAMGNPAVKIAIIDTGIDQTHPDLQGGKIFSAKCFISTTGLPPGTGCNTLNDATDYDGHGTDVSGIAAADANNGFGFVGSGGNVSIMMYRIFPQPPAGGCGASSTSPQCGASTADEITAINDAVANHANVISMSLGGGSSDSTEQAAITAAINAGITVVAASGNESATSLDYPSRYPGVISVGATAINDSTPGKAYEYVAGYSNYVPGSNSWGIVAPGGDPSGNNDADYLHWIENLYSTQAVGSPCTTDAAHSMFSETGDCRVQIAGTSMATPRVAGAIALLLSVSPGMSPAAVTTALQASSHDIGDPKEGMGRLDEYRLIGTALGDGTLPAR